MWSRARPPLLGTLGALLIAVPVAHAQTAPATNTIGGTAPAASATTATTQTDPNALVSPPTLDTPPPLFRMSANQAMAIADKLEDVREARAKIKGSYRSAYQKGRRWQVSYFTPGKERREIAQVIVDDDSGVVLEHYTGYKVAWTMARGYPGAFGKEVNEPWIWITLSILFLLPFLRPPFRWFHLDLVALSVFSISIAFFNNADIDASVPISAPPLAYLFVRMAVVALKRKDRSPPEVKLLVPVSWLAVVAVLLLGFRVGLNVMHSNVIDVGYSGVIGADRIAHGEPIYGNFPKDNEHGDTYGPVAYEVYVPFEAAFPWKGVWNDLPAAHGAAIVFDLLAMILLFALGRRIRGPNLGIVLAYCWAAFPFTIFASNTNTNDSLVSVCVLLALLLAGRPVLRGGAAALGGLTKFAPLALAPVLATHDWRPGRRVRGMALFAVGFLVTAAIVCLPVFLHDDLSKIYDRTIGFQADRGAPFSVWGLYGWDGARKVAQAIGVLFAVLIAFVPRRRDVAGLAAACAAVLIGLQLGLTYWFYLYIVWFFPLVMVAGLARDPEKA